MPYGQSPPIHLRDPSRLGSPQISFFIVLTKDIRPVTSLVVFGPLLSTILADGSGCAPQHFDLAWPLTMSTIGLGGSTSPRGRSPLPEWTAVPALSGHHSSPDFTRIFFKTSFPLRVRSPFFCITHVSSWFMRGLEVGRNVFASHARTLSIMAALQSCSRLCCTQTRRTMSHGHRPRKVNLTFHQLPWPLQVVLRLGIPVITISEDFKDLTLPLLQQQ